MFSAATITAEVPSPDGIELPFPHLRHNPADDRFIDGAVGEEGGHGRIVVNLFVYRSVARSAY